MKSGYRLSTYPVPVSEARRVGQEWGPGRGRGGAPPRLLEWGKGGACCPREVSGGQDSRPLEWGLGLLLSCVISACPHGPLCFQDARSPG